MASQHQNPIRESGIEVELQNRRRSDTKGKKEEINQGQKVHFEADIRLFIRR
jgi:hypothetical protein